MRRWGAVRFAVCVLGAVAGVACDSEDEVCRDDEMVQGTPYDAERGCWEYEAQGLGCNDRSIVEAVEACLKRDSDGALFRSEGIHPPPGYTLVRDECDFDAPWCVELEGDAAPLEGGVEEDAAPGP